MDIIVISNSLNANWSKSVRHQLEGPLFGHDFFTYCEAIALHCSSHVIQTRTNVPQIFAIGDIVGQPMLAHKAVHEAMWQPR